MSPLWLATRSTGLLSLALLTAVTVLGIATAGGWGHSLWPRMVTSGLHRRLSALAVVFLVVHIGTTVIDGYVPVAWTDVIIPFASPYKTVWIGLAALSVDLTIAVIVSSWLRLKLGWSAWHAIHLTAYAAWAFATIHALGAGTDRKLTLAVAAAGAGLVAITLTARATIPARVTA